MHTIHSVLVPVGNWKHWWLAYQRNHIYFSLSLNRLFHWLSFSFRGQYSYGEWIQDQASNSRSRECKAGRTGEKTFALHCVYVLHRLFISSPLPSSVSAPPSMQTNRLQNQAARYKNQVKELEEREDQLMKEKRHQAKEVRDTIHKSFSTKSTFTSSHKVSPSKILIAHNC